MPREFAIGQTVVIKLKPKFKARITAAGPKVVKVKILDEWAIEKYGDGEHEYPLSKVSVEEPDMPIWKRQFPAWVAKRFAEYASANAANAKLMAEYKETGVFKPLSFQQFITEYMAGDGAATKRGILLYHGLGSGKTCTAIQVAEAMKSERNVIVMLPAALKNNFIKDGLEFCAKNSTKNSTKNSSTSSYDKYTFISYNSSNVLAQLRRIGSLDNHTIIIEEAHNLASMMSSNGSKQGPAIYKMLMNARDVKIIALSGTPLINHPYELTLMLNILKGPVEVFYFEIAQTALMGGSSCKDNDPTVAEMATALAKASIKRGGFNYAHLENTLQTMPGIIYAEINLRIRVLEIQFDLPSNDPAFAALMEAVESAGKSVGVELKLIKTDRFSLYPSERELFERVFIKGDTLKNKDTFQRRMNGLVSHYAPKQEGFPKLVVHPPIKVAMSHYQFSEYWTIREKEKSTPNTRQFRTYSRQYSNFAFPSAVKRPGIDEIMKMGVKKKKAAEATKPKAVMSTTNPTEFKIGDSMLSSLTVDEATDVATSEKKKDDRMFKMSVVEEEKLQQELEASEKKYKKESEKAMAELRAGGADYFGANLAKYSAKFSAMLANIRKSPGLVFIYSNFRTLEGIQVLTLMLEANGYEPLAIGDGLAPAKRYAVYSGAEDHRLRDKIIKLYTGPENKTGDLLQVLLVTAAGAEGLDLKNIRQIHITEPYWNEIRIQQLIGRGVRRNSHAALPPSERTVEVFRYLSTIGPKDRASLGPKDRISTDEYIYDGALRKMKLVNETLETLREIAVDCKLFGTAGKAEGKAAGSRCYEIVGDSDGLLYLPNLKKDLGYSPGRAVKSSTKEFKLGAIDPSGAVYIVEQNRGKVYSYLDFMRGQLDDKTAVETKGLKLKKIWIDLNSRKVYDFVHKAETIDVLLGSINDDGVFVR